MLTTSHVAATVQWGLNMKVKRHAGHSGVGTKSLRQLCQIGCAALATFISACAEEPTAVEGSEYQGATSASSQEDRIVPPSGEELVGDWVQAERGGEDGNTRCVDAEIMTSLNGGSTDTFTFYRNGIVKQALWYDTAFESRGEPSVKAAYNKGNWSLDGDQLNISWTGGETGVFGSDMGEGEFQAEVSLAGNVMMQSAEGSATRFVRCK